MSICVRDSIICEEILQELIELIKNYKRFTKTRDSFDKIIVHSGSAPIYGWINNRLGDYLVLGKAIHETPFDNHTNSQYHFRDVYVWHAWLKNNTQNLFKYISEDVFVDGGAELKNLRRIEYVMHGEFNPKEPNSNFYVNDLRNEYVDIDYDSLETYQERFKSDFDKLNKQYPYIGLFHRCLICIRHFNEKYAVKFIDEGILLQKIYYPLFYYINLFIHIATIYYALGNVNYYVLFSSKYPLNKNAVIRENALKYEHYSKSHEKFKTYKEIIKNILDTSYKKMKEMYDSIKNYIKEQITNNGPRKSIIMFDVPYFDVSLEGSNQSISNNASKIETAGYKTTKKSNTNQRVNAKSRKINRSRTNRNNPRSRRTSNRTQKNSRKKNSRVPTQRVTRRVPTLSQMTPETNNNIYKWLHQDYLNNIEKNYGINRNTAFKKLKLNNFNEDLSRKRWNISKINDNKIYRWVHRDFINHIVKNFGVEEKEVFNQLKFDNFNENKSLKYWNNYYT